MSNKVINLHFNNLLEDYAATCPFCNNTIWYNGDNFLYPKSKFRCHECNKKIEWGMIDVKFKVIDSYTIKPNIKAIKEIPKLISKKKKLWFQNKNN